MYQSDYARLDFDPCFPPPPFGLNGCEMWSHAKWKNLYIGLWEQELRVICELKREDLRYPRIALRLVDSYILHLFMNALILLLFAGFARREINNLRK